MRIIAVIIGTLLFILLFVFSVFNTDPVKLRMVGGLAWEAPLVMFLLSAFLMGVLVGLLAMLPSWVRLRLQVGRLRDNLKTTRNTVTPKASKASTGPDTIQSVAQGARTTS